MPKCDLARMGELAALGQVDYHIPKSVLRVAGTLGRTPDEAKLEIRRLVQRLEPTHFHKEGDGAPPPPCDAYVFPAQYWLLGRWETVRWYVKIGIAYGQSPELDVLWIESCHD